MDIRRLALWEGRYATYMSNDIFSSLIEDQGEVLLELTSRTLSGARINALSLPYFRGTGSGVMSGAKTLISNFSRRRYHCPAQGNQRL